MGDQPGQHAGIISRRGRRCRTARSLPWRNSPIRRLNHYTITDPISGATYNVYGFNTNQTFPFPTARCQRGGSSLPWIAFNYLGQLTDGRAEWPGRQDEYIPIAKGSVLYARDPVTKAFLFNSPDVLEIPPGNSTNSSYNIVHIDRLTGRAVLEYQKMQ